MSTSDIIFIGTVQGVASDTEFDTEILTIRVLLGKIIQPQDNDLLKGFINSEVHVQLHSKAPPIGSLIQFNTRMGTLGSQLTLVELEYRPVNKTIPAAVADTEARIKALNDETLRTQLNDAELIVVGRVKALHSAGKTNTEMPAITDHNPSWLEAVIAVEDVLKGKNSEDHDVTIHFPGSDDVMWTNSPKLAVGQESVFIIMRHDPTKSETTVVEQNSVLDKTEVNRINRLLMR